MSLEGELDATRAAIDATDEAIATLLVQRWGLSQKAQRLKRHIGLPAVDQDRERRLAIAWRSRLMEMLALRIGVLDSGGPLVTKGDEIHRGMIDFCKTDGHLFGTPEERT